MIKNTKQRTHQELTPIDTYAQLIDNVQKFYGQTIYANMGTAISNNKLILKIVFRLVQRLSRYRIANMIFLWGVIFCYPAFRLPCSCGKVFQYGMSANNLRAFGRLNSCLDSGTKATVSVNGVKASTVTRLRAALSFRQIWHISGELTISRHKLPLPQVQAVISCAALLLLSQHPTPNKLKVICIASDHLPVSLALAVFARRRGLRVCYVQHAPVTKFFPPLDYDLSILFDRASMQAYEEAARLRDVPKSTSIVLLPPFDSDFEPLRTPERPYKAGICLSMLPNIPELQKLISSLSERPDIDEIQLRPHPRCSLNLEVLLSIEKVTLTQRSENTKSYFNGIDFSLVPNSGVTIESLHYGCPTFYVSGLDEIQDDYYGFVSEGVVPRFEFHYLDSEERILAPFANGWSNKFRNYDELVANSAFVFKNEVQRRFCELLE